MGGSDPSPGRTLAACLTHASRTEPVAGSVANGCVTRGQPAPETGAIPDDSVPTHVGTLKGPPKPWRRRALWDGPASYQVVGGVTAHQADDG